MRNGMIITPLETAFVSSLMIWGELFEWDEKIKTMNLEPSIARMMPS